MRVHYTMLSVFENIYNFPLKNVESEWKLHRTKQSPLHIMYSVLLTYKNWNDGICKYICLSCWFSQKTNLNIKQRSKIYFLKRTFNKSCSVNHYHHLEFKYMQLSSHYSPLPKHKPLLLLHICLLHISSQIKCYSLQSLETPRAAEKHMRSSRARWPSPGSGAAPPAERLIVTTATDSNTHSWTGSTHGTRPAAQPTPPWRLTHDRTRSFNRIKYSPHS